MMEAIKETAELTLAEADPALAVLINRQTLALPAPRSDYFASLTRSIIGQQVSVAAARAIALRFESHTKMDPLKAVSLSDEDTKAIGLSRQKASYIRDLALHFSNNPSVYDHLEALSDDEVIGELTEIKGIGTWTAQMFLMFTLARNDVFAPDDAGLQRAMRLLYGWEKLPRKTELVEVSETWRPYRTFACLHLWQSLDNSPA